MIDESRYLLDSILSDWFQWARGFQPVASHGTSAMFSGVRSSRQWDSESDATDASLHNDQMQTVNFCIDEMTPIHRTALNLQARNLVTGRSVWTSARLPADVAARAVILGEARRLLTVKLIGAGVM